MQNDRYTGHGMISRKSGGKKATLWAVLCALLAAAGSLRAETTLRGSIFGFDGKALPKANVQLFRQGQTRPLATVAAGADGAFELQTTVQGLVMLKFMGVGHQPSQVPVLLEGGEELEVTAQLKPYAFDTAYDSVRVIGDFNKFGTDGARLLTKQEDGTYTAEFETKEKSFSYQLIKLAQNAFGVNGTAADDYSFDQNGTYRSIVKVENGKATVVFDPKLLARPKKAVAEVHFTDSTAEGLGAIFNDITRRRDSYQSALSAHCAAGKSLSTFDYNWAPEITKLTKQIARTKDSLQRQALLIAYLDLGTLDAKRDLSKNVVVKALDEIPPTSPLWALNPRLIPMAIAMTDSVEKYQAYIDTVINEHPDPTVQAPLVYDEMVAARNTNNEEQVDKYYERLITEFVDTPYAGMARFAVMAR